MRNQTRKDNIKVALIDDGVHESMDSVFAKVNRCYVEKGIIYKGTAETVEFLSHGTICAAVVALMDIEIELFDIRIFAKDGAEMMDLITALEHCILCGVQVINLSCGTLNYLEYKKVEHIIRKMQRKNVMIVSAFSNQGVFSFPAGCRKVFGVREDCSGYLKKAEYGFQEFAGGRLENSIVAHADIVTIDGKDVGLTGNSFAAPVITGEIARILKTNPRFSFKQVLRQLVSRSKSKQCKGRELKKYLLCQGEGIGTPIIGIDQRCFGLKEFLKRRLRELGYYVITVSEYGFRKTEIPRKYYMDRETVLNKDILYTIEQIYSPDVIIFFLDKKRFGAKNRFDVMDIMLSKEQGGIHMEIEKEAFFSNKYADILAYVIRFFRSENRASSRMSYVKGETH